MTPEHAKVASHEFLRQHSVQIGEALPVIEAIEDLNPQDARSVAIRSVVLSYVIGIGFNADPRKLEASLQQFGLYDYASAQEQELLSRPVHSQQEKINATWLTECVQSLAWCMGLVELDSFRRCDDDLATHFPRAYTDPRGFIEKAALRPIDEIYQQVDIHYRLHWAAREARLMRKESTLDEGLIKERRKALDWVIGVEADWDNIPLDT